MDSIPVSDRGKPGTQTVWPGLDWRSGVFIGMDLSKITETGILFFILLKQFLSKSLRLN